MTPAYRMHEFDLARESLVRLPTAPALVRVEKNGETREWVVRDLRNWVAAMRDDLIADGHDPAHGGSLRWMAVDEQVLADLAGDKARPAALRPGRPSRIIDPRRAPVSWGLYRILRAADDTWYVGISSNLRLRLSTHQRTGLFDPAAGDHAEVLPVRDAGGNPVLWSDLQDAEREHIERSKQRGKKVRNITAGGNGRPPGLRVHVGVAREGVTLAPRDRNPITVLPRHSRNKHLDLAVRWRLPDADWVLTLRDDNWICAIPGTHGRKWRRGDLMTLNQLVDIYQRQHGRDLIADVARHGWPVPPDKLRVLFWSGEKRFTFDGRAILDSSDLAALRGQDIDAGRLPTELERLGFMVDPAARRAGGVNQVMRVVRAGETGAYLKKEENQHARNAEIVASALLNGLGWVGVNGRVTTTASGSVLVLPDLGTESVEDTGPLHSRLRHLTDESAASLRCNRPESLLRISLTDLSLRMPEEVLYLLLFDAAICNTDRNRTNLKLGRELDAKLGSPAGRLLPVDHGRSLLNADPSRPGCREITPVEALLGTSRYGLPNQLLRPAAELISRDFPRCQERARPWLDQMEELAIGMRGDWTGMQEELDYLINNVEVVRQELVGLFDAVVAAVVA